MSEHDMTTDRVERGNALDRFARQDDEGARRDVVIPQQAFNIGGDRIIGAQAVAVHRDESRILTRLRALAAAAGTDWTYRYAVKNRRENRTDWIEGPSIKLANDLARTYGNCDVAVQVTDIGDAWMIYARFTDFETGFSLTRPFQQQKGAAKIGGADEGRRLDIALQIGASKAIRNVVCNALQTFADFAFEEAQSALVDKIGSKLGHYRGRIIDRLREMNIDQKRVEMVRGRKLSEWLAPDCARTIAEIQAVADGMTSADETWPASSPPAEPAEPEPTAGLDRFATEPNPERAQNEEAPPPAEDTTQAPEAAHGAPDGQETPKRRGRPPKQGEPDEKLV